MGKVRHIVLTNNYYIDIIYYIIMVYVESTRSAAVDIRSSLGFELKLAMYVRVMIRKDILELYSAVELEMGNLYIGHLVLTLLCKITYCDYLCGTDWQANESVFVLVGTSIREVGSRIAGALATPPVVISTKRAEIERLLSTNPN